MPIVEAPVYKVIPEKPEGFIGLLPFQATVEKPKPKKKSSKSNGEMTLYYNNAIFWPADFIDQVEQSKQKRNLDK